MKLFHAIDDAPLKPIQTPYHTSMNASHKIRLRYEVREPLITLYVAIIPYINSTYIGKKFVCDRYDDATKTWTDDIEIDPNKPFNLGVDVCFVFFWFRPPMRVTSPSLEAAALRTLLRRLPDPMEDFRRLPLPDRLMRQILRRHRPLQFWLQYDPRRIFYYHGKPGTRKRLDIHRQLPEVSVGQWKYRTSEWRDLMIAEENELVIVYIPVRSFFPETGEINRIIKVMKDGYMDMPSRRHIPIKARFIFISDYPPESLFDEPFCSDHEWFSRNCFVVEKGDMSPVSSDDVPEDCVHCERPVYFREDEIHGIPLGAHEICYTLYHHETMMAFLSLCLGI